MSDGWSIFGCTVSNLPPPVLPGMWRRTVVSLEESTNGPLPAGEHGALGGRCVSRRQGWDEPPNPFSGWKMGEATKASSDTASRVQSRCLRVRTNHGSSLALN